MYGLTYCEGLVCPLKQSCKRFVEKPRSLQDFLRVPIYIEIPGRFFEDPKDPEKEIFICDKIINI